MTLFSKVLAKILLLLFILSFAGLCFYALMTVVAVQSLSFRSLQREA